MSTAPPSSLEGPCVLCGKATYLRCGECAKHGTDWMRFCGIPHQKLVWSLHKHFCGARSNPFTWPLLTSAEVEEYVELCEEPIHFRGELTTWLDGFAKGESQLSRKQLRVEFKVRGFVSSSDCADGSLRPLFQKHLEDLTEVSVQEPDEQQIIVLKCRSFAQFVRLEVELERRRRTRPNRPDLDVSLPKEFPIDYLARTIYTMGIKELAIPEQDPSRFKFLHLFTFFMAILVENDKAPIKDKDLEECLKYVVQQIWQVLAKEIAPTRPEIGKTVQSSMVYCLIEMW
ncbi:uncharacterized protein JCM6883_002109 [Sporobolomyces salmoneus]|uniref:uncharacterized protein n=1 Tax=Sporobolomyces salmoneus TaxID=183962 RepID=UPI00316C0BB8